MQAKAKAIGLELDPTEEPAISGKNWQGAVTDSYHAFLNGAYALAHDPFYRPIDLAAGNQTMDIEVQNRARRDPTYRPQNPGFPVPPAPQAEV